MSLQRRWVVSCDTPGCAEQLVLEPISIYGFPAEKWDYGIATNDAGWDAAPGRNQTFCPAHFPSTDTTDTNNIATKGRDDG